MLTNLNFRTRLGAMVTTSLIVSGVAALLAVALTAFGAHTLAAVLGILALLAVAGCIFVAAGEIGRTTDLIDRAVASANELTTDRLPRLTKGVLDDDDLSDFEPFDGASRDGVGQVVTALNTVQAATRDLALQQRTLVREGVSNLVVNLVRRNQGLLERQLDHIDRLESSEEDPDRLEDLYGVDHLASRMRRNAESLLVLAGLDPQRRKGDPISINDLMRVAMGEIEGYQNVRITRVDEGEVSAQAALDIAHLLSELLENATQFSPPTAKVELAGAVQPDGGYLISIADHGIGMSTEQLAEYNELLINPPELSLGLGRSLGFLVVARLSQRLGLMVELAPTPSSAGVTALVLVPEPLLRGEQAAPRSATPSVSTESAALDTVDAPTASPELAAATTVTGVPTDTPAEADEPATTASPTVETPTDAPPSDDAEPAWVPPAVPERGSGGLGVPASETDGAAAPTEVAGADAQQETSSTDEPATPARSEALAKLLGVSPSDGSPDTVEAPPNDMPQRLEEAIPSGDTFDAGVAGLLDEDDKPSSLDGGGTAAGMPPQRTSKGLAKRDRSKSRAPVGEGRVIPDSGGNAVAASSRDPQEIRDMLARYRKAREGTNPDGNPDQGEDQ
jgi:signal transduction histidine kinase